MQFEKDAGDDPFGVASLIEEVEKKTGGKRYGLDKGDDERASKRARMDSDEE